MEPYRERIEDFMRRYGLVLAVAVVLVALAVVLAGWGEPPYQGPWDVEPRLVGWWRALCTLLR